MIARLIPFASLIVAAGLVFGYMVPTYNNAIKPAQERIKSLDAALAAADSFKQKEADIEKERASLAATDLERLQAFLPDGVNNVQLILDLDNLAASTGVTLSNFNVDTSSLSNGGNPTDPGALALQSSNPIDSVDITVEATGTYEQFRTFLMGIENSLRPLDVTDLSVSGATDGNGRYKYDLTLRIYWLH